MDCIFIPTEDAEQEQWRMVSRLSYARNIREEIAKRHSSPPDDSLVEFVAGSIRQSEVYFRIAGDSPLDVSPLLLYYGATALFAAVYGVLVSARPPINDHGMKVLLNAPVIRLADTRVRPRNPTTGALQQFANVYSDGCALSGSGEWTLEEVLGSIPDLRREYEDCYAGVRPFVIPVEVVASNEGPFERIEPAHLSRFPNPEDALRIVPQFSDAYLTPQYGGNMTHVVLRYKIGGPEVGIYSIFGDKFLPLAHVKNSTNLFPSQEILMLVGLHILGYMSRYRPEIWNPFVRGDESGERLIVERFLSVCQRYLPNLVLNRLHGQRIQFVSERKV